MVDPASEINGRPQKIKSGPMIYGEQVVDPDCVVGQNEWWVRNGEPAMNDGPIMHDRPGIHSGPFLHAGLRISVECKQYIWVKRHSGNLQLVPPFILNKHIQPFWISNQKYHCYMNSMIQLLFSILRTISHNFQWVRSSLSKCLFETAHGTSSSTDVDAIIFLLVQYDTFYEIQIRQGRSECLMMLI